jgi:SAM-dependent methyltransferase
MQRDVPSPIDLCRMNDAREWTSGAMSKRPWRTEFFAEFARVAQRSATPVQRILELGSGPGFLAQQMLSALPSITYVALDFSPAMHELAAERLGSLSARVQFLQRSFREPDWSRSLGLFECVATHQAVHELRHKQYAVSLHAQVRSLLTPGGFYLVCDHFVGEGGMKNDQLYMTVDEQKAALVSAGFCKVEQLLLKGGLVLHCAS